jgi:hypothetical protein
VRQGSDAAIVLALKETEKQIGLLGALVRRRVGDASITGYENQWAKAEAAERAFYDSAASELRTAEDQSKTTARLIGPR